MADVETILLLWLSHCEKANSSPPAVWDAIAFRQPHLAKTAAMDKQVIAVCGDGSFQMSMMELATIRQHNIPVKIIVLKNNYLGMVSNTSAATTTKIIMSVAHCLEAGSGEIICGL